MGALPCAHPRGVHSSPSSPHDTLLAPPHGRMPPTTTWSRRVLLRIKTYLPSWEAGPSDLNEWLDTFAAEQAPRRPRAAPAPLRRPRAAPAPPPYPCAAPAPLRRPRAAREF